LTGSVEDCGELLAVHPAKCVGRSGWGWLAGVVEAKALPAARLVQIKDTRKKRDGIGICVEITTPARLLQEMVA
jgi:hypothetical protein